MLFGAAGGLGAESKGSFKAILRGFHYLDATNTNPVRLSLVIWPQRLEVRLKLYKTDTLYKVSGLAGVMACDQVGTVVSMYITKICIIGQVYNIPTMQFLTGNPRNTQLKSFILSALRNPEIMHCRIPNWKIYC